MHRPPAPTAALLAAAALLSLSAAATDARAADSAADLKAGREALGRGDGPAAVSLLESALLAVSSAERAAVLDDLRLAYERAASQADAAGDARRARLYRENLQIINRSRQPADPPPAGAGATSPPAIPADSPPEPLAAEPPTPPEAAVAPPAEGGGATPAAEAAPIPVRAPEPAPAGPPEAGRGEALGASLPRGAATPPAEASRPQPVAAAPETPPATPAAEPGQAVADLLRSADAAFRAQKYEDAGRIYAAMAEQGRLPESHKPVWAYCRFVSVARRINSQPSSPAEWSAIHAEIREVRALAPEIWFSEYLRRLAAERSAAVGARPSAFIVRAQAGAEGSAAPAGSWQVKETANFRIFHADPALADRFARRVEQARADLFRYWTGAEPPGDWSPRCDVYLYPNASIYAQMTGQPADSPGFSTMGLNKGRVVARRINLRADADRLVEAVAPHEVSHVVLADLFPTQQIPRWADEGMAVIAEPADAQASRLADLDRPLSSGRVFRCGAMLTSPMPDGRYWDLYMAQSASLTRYLIQLDTPGRFVTFLKESERLGAEAALRSVYGFEGLDDLHTRWLSHARRGPSTASAGVLAVRPEGEAVAR